MSSEAGQHPIDAERLLIKEGGAFQVHRLVQILVEVLVKAVDIDAQFLKQAECLLAVMMRCFERLGSAVADQ